MDDIHWGLAISRFLHIGSAIAAVGGAIFMRLALMPAARDTLTSETHESLHDAVRLRWARIVHVCILLLLVTGAVNFYILAIVPRVDPVPYHPIFSIKVLISLILFVIAWALASRSATLAGMRRSGARWLNILLLLAALVVLLSGMLGQVRAAGAVEKATEASPGAAHTLPQ